MNMLDQDIADIIRKMNGTINTGDQCHQRSQADNESFPDTVNKQKGNKTKQDNVKNIHGLLLQP
jgi:hypothetical protein